MARRTFKDCDQEIAGLKQSIKILSDEIVKRNAYILDVEQELNRVRVELDQKPDEMPGYVLVQARMRGETVAIVEKLQKQLGLGNRTEALVQGIHLLEQSQLSFKEKLTNKVKSLLYLSLLGLMSCAASAPSSRPVSYPWQCEQDPAVKQCTLLGYVINTDNHYIAEMYGDSLCDDAPKSITHNPNKHEFFIVCK